MWKPWEKDIPWCCDIFSKDKYKGLYSIDSHTQGQSTRIVISGVPYIPGKTMAEKKQCLEKDYDFIRTATMHEPRGHRDMFGSILMKPVSDNADFGIVFMDAKGYLNMCGHGTIGAATAIVEAGMVEVKEPNTIVVFDTPAGIVKANVNVKNGKVQEVSITNVPSFVFKRDIEIEMPEIGIVKLDIAFGGSFFAIVDAKQLGVKVLPQNINSIMEKALRLRQIINDKVRVYHPEQAHIKTVDLVEVCEPVVNSDADGKNVVVYGTGQFDRSPCGTGTSAKLSLLYDKKEIKIDEPFIYESIIGTKFKGKILDETKVGDFDAITPEITGKAYIMGCNYIMADDIDPFAHGFVI